MATTTQLTRRKYYANDLTWHPYAVAFLKQMELNLSPEQEDIFFDTHRIQHVAAGEGSGKSFIGALKCVVKTSAQRATWKEGPDMYGWVVGADYEDAREEVMQAREMAIKLGIYDESRSSFPIARDQAVVLTLTTGVSMRTVSAHDTTKLGREEPDFIVGGESSRWSGQAFKRCEGRLIRRWPYSWMYESGSFEAALDPWFKEIYYLGLGPNDRDLLSFSMPTWSNPVVYPGGRNDPAIKLIEASTDANYFLERYAGKPAAPSLAMFPQFKVTTHVWELEVVEDQPVFLAVDPGTEVYCVLFLQMIHGEVRILDEIYVSHWSHDEVLDEVMARPLWRKVDSGDPGTIDTAAKQDHFGMGTPANAWYDKTGLRLRMKYVKLEQTIERLRSVLSYNPATQRPRLIVHPRCKGLIAELGGGPSPVEGGGLWKKSKSGKPEARNDHACKALAYFLVQRLGTARPGEDDDETPEDTGPGAGTYLTPIGGAKKEESFGLFSYLR